MSRAGAGKRKPRNAADALMQGASRNLYVCALKSQTGGRMPGMRTIRCALGCGRDVVAVPWILAEQRARARSLGRRLEVSCYRCAIATSTGAVVLELPKTLDADELERLQRPA